MRKVIYTILVFTMALSLVACGKRTKTAAEVELDVLSKHTYLAEYKELESYSFELGLRKTDSKNGTDEVHCNISAMDEFKTIERSYKVDYYLYDQGWILEEIEVTEAKTSPLKSTVTLEQAQKYFEENIQYHGYGDPEYFPFAREVVDLENRRHVFYFENPTSHSGYELVYYFDGWDRVYEWKVSGLWYISDLPNEDGVIPVDEVIKIPAED